MSWVSNKFVMILVILGVVAAIVLSGVIYIRSLERDRLLLELQEQQNERRNKVNEAIRTAPTNVDDSLQYLRDRK